MTGARIDLDDAEALSGLQRILAAAGDLDPVLDNIGVQMRQSTIARILAERSPDGTAFAPLNPLYAETKQGPGILRGKSGRLASIIYQLAGGDSVEWGTDMEYGAAHQFGVTIKPKNAPALVFSMGGRRFAVKSVTIPARPYLGINEDDRAAILKIVSDHFQMAVEDASARP